MFVAVDGPNGVGKSTLVAALQDMLRDRGLDVLALRQPSDTEFGTFVRSAEHGLRGRSLATLVVADRLWQMRRQVLPALDAGQVVITDRHIASTLVLQRIDGIDLEALWEMNADVQLPDLQVILIAAPDVLRERLDQRGRLSRFERSAGIERMEVDYFRDAAAFLQDHGVRVVIVETDDVGIDAIASEVFGALDLD